MYLNREKILACEQEQFNQLVASGGMTPEAASTLMERRKTSLSKPPSEDITDDMLAVAKFVEGMLGRQASHPPDFEDLYRRKQELDATRDEDVRPAE